MEEKQKGKGFIIKLCRIVGYMKLYLHKKQSSR